MKLVSIIKLMRLDQYLKNIFIFLPLFFSTKVTEIDLLSNSLLGFIAFSLTASAIYTLNDYFDIEEDRLHPKKKDRPLASGIISKPQAILIMSVLSVLGGLLMALLSLKAVTILIAYIAMNIAYSISLKHIPVVDVNVIAIGFVLRLYIGSAVTDLPLSNWIVILTYLLALFMALSKRRDDVLIFIKTGEKMRKVIDGYNLRFLDISILIMAAVVIIIYAIYTTTSELLEKSNSENLPLTSLFVILGVLRFLKITFVDKKSGAPTNIVITDHLMQLILLGWISTFAWVIYS